MRYDWLSQHCFESIAEIQDYATKWLWTYNHQRPNTAIGGVAPKQKLAQLARWPLLLTSVNNGGITHAPGKDVSKIQKEFDHAGQYADVELTASNF